MTDAQSAIELIQRGQAAARVGHRDEAREYLRRAVDLVPENAEAWLALAGVEDDPAAKIACFETVLKLDPDNIDARLGLEMLQGDPEKTGSQIQVGLRTEQEEDELEAVIAAASRRLDEVVGPPPADEVPLDDEVLYCANHPDRETMLRCNRCSKLICTHCAVQTPVGYRCKQCVGQQQAVFYSGGVLDYVIAGAIGLVLGGIASYIITLLGVWFFSLILGPVIGIAIAEAIRLAVRRRRSRYLWTVAAGSIIVGAVPALLLSLASLSLWSLLALGLFLVLAMGAVVARLR
jgi:tetratricopeptide (TPR) repeat protein